MNGIVLYHNPRCSKSRAALALLEERGVEPEVVRYLETPLSVATLTAVAAKLDGPAWALVRTGEAEFAQAGIGPESGVEDIAAAIVKAPKLLQRPIAVSGDRAIIGRPPEDVLALLD